MKNDETNSYTILLFCDNCKKWNKVKENYCLQCNKKIENKNSISFIIPSLSEEPQTLLSIPKEAEVVISKWKPPDEFNSHIKEAYNYDKKLPNELISGMAVARNVGAHYSHGKVLFFIDDDIQFSNEFFNIALYFVENGNIIGLKNPWNNYIIGRFVGITRFDFIVSGGFPPLIIAEDMEFSYRLEALGFKIHYFPEESVKRLKDTPASDYMKFWKYMKTHLILGLMYHVYTKKLPKIFIEYFYRHLKGDYK
jgi:glycosyltransferase involved in cell wall biosynthesis